MISSKTTAAHHPINHLPYQLTLTLLRRIIATNGFKGLQNLLTAVPQLSKYFLLVVDHPKSPYRFIRIQTLKVVSISSLDGMSRQEWNYRASDVIVVSSLVYGEEYSGLALQDHFHRTRYHSYVLALEKSLFTHALLFEPTSVGTFFIRKLAGRSEVSCLFHKSAPKGWIHFLKGNKDALCEGQLSVCRRSFWYPKGNFRKLLTRLTGLHLYHPPLLTTFSGGSPRFSKFTVREDFPFVETIKLSTEKACSTSKLMDSFYSFCFGPVLRLRAPKVQNLFVSYKSCIPPFFPYYSSSIKKLASDNDPTKAVFCLDNRSWNSRADPFTVPMCTNRKSERTGSTHRDLTQGWRHEMPFVKRFHTVILNGVSANVLVIMDLTEARQIVWSRLIDHTTPPSLLSKRRLVFRLPNLRKLTLKSVVRNQFDYSFAPRVLFQAPNLSEINLIALSRSNEPWDIGYVLLEPELLPRGQLCLLLAGALPNQPTPKGVNFTIMPLEDKHIASVAADLKSLMVSDYTPQFLLHPTQGLCFPFLERLSVDVYGCVSSSLVGCRRTLSIALGSDRFPKLQRFTITLSMGPYLSCTDSALRALHLVIPDTVNQIQICRFLVAPLQSLVVNDADLSASLLSIPPPSIVACDFSKVVSWRRNATDNSNSAGAFTREELFSSPEIWTRYSERVDVYTSA